MIPGASNYRTVPDLPHINMWLTDVGQGSNLDEVQSISRHWYLFCSGVCSQNDKSKLILVIANDVPECSFGFVGKIWILIIKLLHLKNYRKLQKLSENVLESENIMMIDITWVQKLKIMAEVNSSNVYSVDNICVLIGEMIFFSGLMLVVARQKRGFY